MIEDIFSRNPVFMVNGVRRSELSVVELEWLRKRNTSKDGLDKNALEYEVEQLSRIKAELG